MKKLLAVISGMLLAGFLLATAMAGSDRPAQTGGQNVQQGAVEQSNVSQAQIETVSKREEAKKQQKQKMKVRAKNLKSSPKPNDQLFQKSK